MSMWMVLSGRPRPELVFSGGGLGAGWGLCWTDCTVSMVSRYVCNMTKFKNNEQPGTILAPPRARPNRRRQPPYPVRSSVLLCTLVHPTASHFPPPGIPKRCPSLHPGATPVKTPPRPRPRRLVPRFRPATSVYWLYTQPPSRHRQCGWHARRKPRQICVC